MENSRCNFDEGAYMAMEESDIHRLKSNGEVILIFKDHLRPAQFLEYSKIIKVVVELRKLVKTPAH